MAHPLTSEWQFVATLSLADLRVDGNWDAIDGGDTTSPTRSYRPGGNVAQQALAGVPTTGDVVLERAYRGEVDGSLRRDLVARIGRTATVQYYAMADDRTKVPGSGESIRGILKEVTRPSFRSESDGVSLYRVIVTPVGTWFPS
ncbi:hypothetical protein [Conexibacter sp. CPCC 206217]|uniref:hypothetical protein n=1 Tax=Conexibacter sp. CPCC 206217 TaxID=3064574 RepID=UPI0027207198|nr:hypothetical protein [Conexibacter sp. CPCC 206217]MDO8209297.1 hypothetical protein [Conexibacter sp. CPCC 206217]